jgi:hypothetical protein
LLEIPEGDFEQAYDDGSLDELVEEKAGELRKLDLEDARKLTAEKLDLLASKSGAGSGEGLRSLVTAVWRALTIAAVATTPSEGSGLSSLTGSLEAMGGADETSSTPSL